MPAAKRHNLPQQLTSFIGHEEDLDEYAALLDQTRLLTLTGIGGCGKTRLAIKLAERFLQSFPDGVWYVDLAPLLDAERMPLTVATTLGIREENNRPIVDTLCAPPCQSTLAAGLSTTASIWWRHAQLWYSG